MDPALLRLLQDNAHHGEKVLPQVRQQDSQAGQRHTQQVQYTEIDRAVSRTSRSFTVFPQLRTYEGTKLNGHQNTKISR